MNGMGNFRITQDIFPQDNNSRLKGIRFTR